MSGALARQARPSQVGPPALLQRKAGVMSALTPASRRSKRTRKFLSLRVLGNKQSFTLNTQRKRIAVIIVSQFHSPKQRRFRQAARTTPNKLQFAPNYILPHAAGQTRFFPSGARSTQRLTQPPFTNRGVSNSQESHRRSFSLLSRAIAWKH
jgi:hypothetical protein